VIGGLAHPEHRVLSKIVQESQSNAEGTVLCYTLPKDLAELQLANRKAFDELKKKGITTFPNPTFKIDLQEYWPTKRKAAEEYRSQRNRLQRAYLLPENESD